MLSDESVPHARSSAKYLKLFRVSEVNSEFEQTRGPNT
jgi:hypothetical protein